MATIRKRKDKYIVIYDYLDDAGKRKQKWVTCASKQEAQKLKIKVEHDKINNSFIVPSKQTLESFLYEWVELHAKAHWQYNTYTSSIGMIKNHIIPTLGNKSVQDISPKDIEKLYDTLRNKKLSTIRQCDKDTHAIPCLSSTTIRHIHNILKSAFDKAVEWNIVGKSPITCASPKKNCVEKRIWTAIEVKL